MEPQMETDEQAKRSEWEAGAPAAVYLAADNCATSFAERTMLDYGRRLHPRFSPDRPIEQTFVERNGPNVQRVSCAANDLVEPFFALDCGRMP